MILASSELEKIAKDNITALNNENIRGASIDLSIGDKALIQKNKGNEDIIDLFNLDCDEELCNNN